MGAKVFNRRRGDPGPRCRNCKANKGQLPYGLCGPCERVPAVVAKVGRACRHCVVNRGSRPRQLCGRHYYDPAVRERYASRVPRAGRKACGDAADTLAQSRPTQPHPHPPWSDAAIAAMAERVRRRESVTHRDDGGGVDLS